MSWLNWWRSSGVGTQGANVFRDIYDKRAWRGRESASGRGSDSDQTRVLRERLPGVIGELGVRSLLDLPCGDFHWMRDVVSATQDLSYVGADIVEALVHSNGAAYGANEIEFRHLNLLHDQLPPADMLFCRDCLVHLSEADIRLALANILRSSFTYVALTTFPDRDSNRDIATGRWRPLNLQAAPFGFPPPLRLLKEECTEEDGRFADKALGIWRFADLRR